MITEILTFAVLTGGAEFLLFAKLSPRVRLRVLNWPTAISIVALFLNLTIHWGTIVGSMTAITAFFASAGAVAIARWYWGWIEAGRYYHHGRVVFDYNVLR